MPDDKWIKRREKLGRDDEKFKQDVQRKMDRRREKLEKPFGHTVAKRLFWLLLIIVGCFGTYDVVRLAQGTPGLLLRDVLGSTLVASLLVGTPLLAICLVQLRRIKHGQLAELPADYILWLRVCAGLVGLLLLGWLVSLLL